MNKEKIKKKENKPIVKHQQFYYQYFQIHMTVDQD